MIKNKVEKFPIHEDCPVRNVFDRFGDKWSVLILIALDTVPQMRFNELHKGIDIISQKMLTVTLKTLEADGLVKRTMFPQIPPRVEYALTERGKSLIPHIHNLVAWSKEHMSDIQASRAAYNKQLV
ncbi:transcriptional regulator [Taibaiella sp. KBW10]|uniref:winged helix-turn-helix transcriptional regulator n=1 Tax=Taibaiella sp. KBW10 TaxID=2153357 RepID=UPI000F5AFD98|nr:helix-turn-helix domain-containing protein [Taibaiella sp. KBW10]RQO31172.1 transcriptional regulator [Taibaiella sp. KBW10]